MGVLIDSFWWKGRLDTAGLEKDMAVAKGRVRKGAAEIKGEVEGGFTKTFSKLGSMFSSLFAVATISMFLSNVIGIRSEFEKFEAVLTNTLGSKSKAQMALQDITDFASKTPFQVTELSDAFVKLANQGFTPTLEEMRKLGDLASSTGKSFDQLTEGILDAQMGQWERMKEFGTKANVEGNKVKVTFKGATTEINNNADAIRGLILSYGDLEGVAGSMEAISETLGGKISNLSDTWDQFLNHLGSDTGGVMSTVIGWLSSLISMVDRAVTSLSQIQKKVDLGIVTDQVQQEKDMIQMYTTQLTIDGMDIDEAKKKATEIVATQIRAVKDEKEEELRIAKDKYDKLASEGKKFTWLWSKERKQAFFQPWQEVEHLTREVQIQQGILEGLEEKAEAPKSGKANREAELKEYSDNLEKMKKTYQQRAKFAELFPEDVKKAYADLGYESFDAYLTAILKSTKDMEKKKLIIDAFDSIPKARQTPLEKIASLEPNTKKNLLVEKERTEFIKYNMRLQALQHSEEAGYIQDIENRSQKQIKLLIKNLQEQLNLVRLINKEKAKDIQERIDIATEQLLDNDQRQFNNKIRALQGLSEVFSHIEGALGETISGLSEVAQQVVGIIQSSKRGDKSGVQGGLIGLAISGASWVVTEIGNMIGTNKQAKDKEFSTLLNSIAELKVAMDHLNTSFGAERLEDYATALERIRKAGQTAAHAKLKEPKRAPVKMGRLDKTFGSFEDLDVDKLTKMIAWEEARGDENMSKRERKFRDAQLAQLKQLLEFKQQELEIQNEFNEALTGSTRESIADSISQGFDDGLATVEDFAQNMNSVIKKAILTAFKAQYIDKQVDDWYKSFATRAEGGLTEQEIKDSKAEWEVMMQTQTDAWKVQKDMMDQLGITGPDSEEEKQKKGLAGAIKGITEDTADVLAGQLGAIRINVLEQLETAKMSLEYHREIAMNTRRLAKIEQYLGSMAAPMPEVITRDRVYGR